MEIPEDVQEKLLRFARAGIAAVSYTHLQKCVLHSLKKQTHVFVLHPNI